MSAPTSLPRIAIIGFGEVGPIFAQALHERGCEVAAYDLKLQDPASADVIRAKAARSGARVAGSLSDCLNQADWIFSAVTASQAGAVARDAAAFMQAGQIFIDLNSVSPRVKQENCARIQQAGGEYIESAVMAPVPPQGVQVPMLLGGRRAREMAESLNALGMRTQAVADDVGLASAIKLCRSIMIKGHEALCLQSMQAALHFGVDERVLASLAATFPGVGWDKGYEAYLIGRVAEHGQRRSEEMREAAAMLDELGLDSGLASAIADVQQDFAQRGRGWLTDLDARGGLPGWRDLLA
ncbi:DUF1932 domain-containing protein [Bordetella holmesii]|uniref:NADP oxidoreductase coenzyme F420-dependent n=2 Tax=Bordetella holmesii TaxID=35814 RepID=A0A158M126_9BORD|nr:DUF1932 domain-containing protein [Bordetella holmesii]AHV94913.1 NAD-dependent glycerol-3-phosphate dehydrogenase family protein [Bordetella holmesii ATCC 51541]AIT25533.1 NAD-dependent glycerol-3-phosphate dehydrogenase family protein [Bordetella holmesii 44057]EWM41841.1 NAD-dependent glycerol-3-phosphate dehydrogenase family protein [Bordetella holmesii 41130]EWM46099.1 NAD-dependent glycerol-3-phosphate dehydrogenase family protein [Bordetella holmesii 35009]EWM50253.1 NAD-dependent gl